jgi:hypothetical protein
MLNFEKLKNTKVALYHVATAQGRCYSIMVGSHGGCTYMFCCMGNVLAQPDAAYSSRHNAVHGQPHTDAAARGATWYAASQTSPHDRQTMVSCIVAAKAGSNLMPTGAVVRCSQSQAGAQSSLWCVHRALGKDALHALVVTSRLMCVIR